MPDEEDLYDVALRVTDEVIGPGTYARMNEHHPDPGVQAAISRWKAGLKEASMRRHPSRED